VRQACPATPIGVSTGLWITEKDPQARTDAVTTWSGLPRPSRPDFASVNLSEPGFAALTMTLVSLGIAVPADTLAMSGLAEQCTRLLVEVIAVPADAATGAAREILARLDALDLPGQRVVHGEDEATWPLVALAGKLGLATRIGLEDTTTGPHGNPVRNNAELVQRALMTWTANRSTLIVAPTGLAWPGLAWPGLADGW
jgi:hypothetical protein